MRSAAEMGGSQEAAIDRARQEPFGAEAFSGTTWSDRKGWNSERQDRKTRPASFSGDVYALGGTEGGRGYMRDDDERSDPI